MLVDLQPVELALLSSQFLNELDYPKAGLPIVVTNTVSDRWQGLSPLCNPYFLSTGNSGMLSLAAAAGS